MSIASPFGPALSKRNYAGPARLYGMLDDIRAGSFAVCTIGSCLIRQSFASPIVCVHQSTRFLRLLSRAKALVGLCLGLTSGGRRQLPPLFLPVTCRGYSRKSPACSCVSITLPASS